MEIKNIKVSVEKAEVAFSIKSSDKDCIVVIPVDELLALNGKGWSVVEASSGLVFDSYVLVEIEDVLSCNLSKIQSRIHKVCEKAKSVNAGNLQAKMRIF